MPDAGFLDSLTPEQQRELRANARVQRFSRGTALLSERQVGDRVMVILRGRVKVTRVTTEGREVVLGFRGAGDLLGEQAAIDGDPRSGTAVALEQVETLTVATSAFLSFLARTPDASLLLMRLLSQRLRDADRKRAEFAATDTVGRVCARLIELAERFGEREGETVVITLPMTQEELAGWCGSSRDATAKALHKLRELGWVDTARRRIAIHDMAAVAEHAAR